MGTRSLLAVVPLVGLLAVALAGPEDAPKPFGIDERVPLTTSTVVGSPDPPLPYRAKRAYPNYSPAFPIMAKAVPGTGQLSRSPAPRPPSSTIRSGAPATTAAMLCWLVVSRDR